jgi:hypothetical protein
MGESLFARMDPRRPTALAFSFAEGTISGLRNSDRRLSGSPDRG